MVEPAVAKLAPWLKFEPSESRKALRFGNPKLSAGKLNTTQQKSLDLLRESKRNMVPMKSIIKRPSQKRPAEPLK